MNKRKIPLIVSLLIFFSTIFIVIRAWTPEAAQIEKSPDLTLTEEPLVIAITPNEVSPYSCAYTWAYHDVPEVRTKFEAAVKAILPEANTNASAFGEDCMGADGRAISFITMETDFYVILTVTDLNDNGALGDLIAQVLPVLDNFAPGSIPGPKEGFIEFTFRVGDDQRVVRIPLPLGRELREKGVGGAELIAAIEPP